MAFQQLPDAHFKNPYMLFKAGDLEFEEQLKPK